MPFFCSHFGRKMFPLARGRLKAHLEVKYGESSKSLEAALRSASFKILRHFSTEEKKAEGLPCWLGAAALDYFAHPCRVALGIVTPDSAPPEKPADLPEESQRKKSALPVRARGFDYFCWLEKEKILDRCEKLQKKGKWKDMPKPAVMKVVGGQMWGKLSPTMQMIHVERAVQRIPGGRDSDGKFVVGHVPDAPPEPIAAEIPEEPEAPPEQEDDAPIVTPKKRRGRVGQARKFSDSDTRGL